MTTEEIERMLKDTSEAIRDSKPAELKRLGIDEIALLKGKGNYCTVSIDLDTSKLIALLSDRRQEVVKEILIEWGTEVFVVEGINNKLKLIKRSVYGFRNFENF
ncbi:transposase [Dendronalium sp. ChiSLP03b]|uniref:transposase n=1 Tax=Dendronalium sp. ChiSLP03b TaxID=3075381 RepID=UPI003918A812